MDELKGKWNESREDFERKDHQRLQTISDLQLLYHDLLLEAEKLEIKNEQSEKQLLQLEVQVDILKVENDRLRVEMRGISLSTIDSDLNLNTTTTLASPAKPLAIVKSFFQRVFQKIRCWLGFGKEH